jgi:thiosulfate dehydrogenase [quinone] large subunit
VVAADLLDAGNQPVAHYDAAALSALPKTAFENDYAYNKFATGPFGIQAPMGAAATVTLPRPASGAIPQARSVRLTDVNGRTFSATLDGKP